MRQAFGKISRLKPHIRWCTYVTIPLVTLVTLVTPVTIVVVYKRQNHQIETSHTGGAHCTLREVYYVTIPLVTLV